MFSTGTIYLFMLAMDIGLFVNVLFMLMYITDVESDYINPIDCCKDLNKYVLPELALQYILTLFSFFTGSWITIILILPITAFNSYRIATGNHIYDPTQIYRELNKHKTEYFSKLAFFLLALFYFLFRAILSFVDEKA